MSETLYHCKTCKRTCVDEPEVVQSVEGWSVACPICGAVTTYRRRDLDLDLLARAFELEVL